MATYVEVTVTTAAEDAEAVAGAAEEVVEVDLEVRRVVDDLDEAGADAITSAGVLFLAAYTTPLCALTLGGLSVTS
jgi:hypothetical protein